MPKNRSHIYSDSGLPFNLDAQQQHQRMNVNSDILRQAGPPPSQMLSLNNQPFLQNQSQPGPQQPPNSMVVNANPSVGMLGGSPANPNNAMVTPGQRYQLQMQQAGNLHQQQQRTLLLRQSQAGQPLGPSTGPLPNPHIAGLGHNQLQGMGFHNNMVQSGNSVPVRRVTSQPQLNPGAGHMGGMPQAVSNMSMGMNPHTSMPAHLRQAAQQQQHLRLQQSIQISPEMAMAMNRPPANPGVPQNITRTGSAQLMNSLTQPPSLAQAQHPSGMQSSHHPNNFQTSIPLPSQQQQPQVLASPRSGSHSQSHTPSMSMATPGPSQAAVNRSRVSPENPMSVMSFPNAQFQQVSQNPARIPSNNGQFPFVPSSTPPDQMGEMSHAMPTALNNTPGSSSSRTGFQPTPAQLAEMQQNSEVYHGHFNMPPPNVPPRPASHNKLHPPLPQQQQPQHRNSPHQSDHMNIHISHPQRPQSQPQAQPGRPPSQSGPSNTPRTSQSQLPGNPGPLPAGRIPLHQTGGPPQTSASGQPLPIAPRPPPQTSITSPTATSSSEAPAGAGAVPRPQPNSANPVLGLGQGLSRLLQFSGNLSAESPSKLQLLWWSNLINDYFTPNAVMKLTLWKDNQRNEAKPFEIGVPILPRFFLVTTQSGVETMTLSLDGSRERMYSQGRAIVECVNAVWTYKYNNGYTVTLRGPLTAHVVVSPSSAPSGATLQPPLAQYTLKFDDFQFDANRHDKYIALESIMGSRNLEPSTPRTRNASTPTVNGSTARHQREEDKKWDEPRIIIERGSIPGEPVNAFGIPQATMRCLELAESVGQMADLITYSNERGLGPIDALNNFAAKIRETQPHNPTPQGSLINGVNSGLSSHQFVPFPNNNGVAASPAITLYSSAPPSVINAQPAPPMNHLQNVPPSADHSPQKQHKSLQQSQAPAPASVPTPTSTPATAPASSVPNSNTPSLSNASLKRKQSSDTTSPTTANAEPQPKRVTRKRGRTGGGA